MKKKLPTSSAARRAKSVQYAIESLESRILLTTYYISNAGNDAAAGTSAATAWASVTKVDATTFAPGDTILFQRGGEWHGQLEASSDGTAANPITYSDYGNTALAKPIFDGSDNLASNVFTSLGNNVYSFSTSASPNGNVYWVYVNHVALLAATSGGPGMPANSFFISGNTVFINLTGAAATDPTAASTTVSVGDRATGQNPDQGVVASNGHSNLVFNNFIGRETAEVPSGGGLAGGYTDAYVFRAQGGSNITFSNDDAYFGGKHHIGAIDVSGFVAINDTAQGVANGVAGNTLPFGNATAFVAYSDANRTNDTYQFINDTVSNYDGAQPAFLTHNDGANSIKSILLQNFVSNGSQIALEPGTNVNITIEGGSITNNTLVAYTSTGTVETIDGMTVSGDGSYIQVNGNATVQNSVVKNSSQDGGIQVYGPNNVVRFNTLSMLSYTGSAIHLENGSSNTTLLGNLISGTAHDIKIDGGGTTYTADYDFFDSSAGAATFYPAGATDTLAQFQAAGKETHGATDVPNFTNAANGDYSLLIGSPAINLVPTAGITGITTDIRGNGRPNGGAFDAGAYETLLTNHPPTITTQAAATPNPVTGTTVGLSVAATDPDGNNTLTYTWSLTGTPPAPVTFNDNGDNTSNSTTATFTKVGTYNFQVAVFDGQTTLTSAVAVTVNPTPTTVSVTPATKFVPINTTQQYAAAANDQFGNAITGSPITWSVTGGGSISSAGLYTAPGAAGGSATIKATSGAFNGTAVATITPPNQPPTVATAAAGTPNPVTGITTALSVLGADDNGEANLTYTWAVVGTPPAAVVFNGTNGTNASKSLGATFSANGTYAFQVTITDSNGASVTSSTNVVVNTIVPIVLDGTKDPRYGTAAAVQTQATNFGNGQLGGAAAAPYTQLAAAYGIIDLQAGKFYLFIAGSLNLTNSHLDLLIDSEPGVGVANLSALANVGPYGTAFPTVAFDAGFRPDHLFSFGGAAGQYLDYDDLVNNVYKNEDMGHSPDTGAVTDTVAGIPSFSAAVNNAAQAAIIAANTGGSVTTGIEIAFKLSDLGYTAANYSAGTPINVEAIVSYGSHTEASNQILAPYTPNPAELTKDGGIYTFYGNGNFDFGNETRFAGKQYFSIAPAAGGAGSNAAPTIATPASANANPVTGTTTTLAVLGADDGGESNLTYTWSVVGTPPAVVTFGTNGNNVAKSTLATFTKAGSYSFLVTVSDGSLSTTSNVNVTVNQTATTVAVSPTSASVSTNATQQFAATVNDQFGNAIASPTITWSIQSGVGSVDTTGLYTAPATTGSAVVKATSGTISNTASVNVTAVNHAPTIATIASTSPNPVTGTSANLSVLGADDGGESNLTYTWSTTGTLPAAVVFSSNGSNASKSSIATFNKAGAYTFLVTIQDAGGLTVTSSVNVTVNQTTTTIAMLPNTATIAISATQAFTASANDQFGQAIAVQPVFAWSVDSGGVGSINAAGLYTAPATAGSATVRATAGGKSGAAAVTVATAGVPVYQFNAGGPAVGSFAFATGFGGTTGTYSTAAPIDMSGVTNPAPQAVYQTERFGSAFTYTFYNLTVGKSYQVRMHFAEVYFTSAGQRIFNVAVNGTAVLSNFDIFAAAGGANKAVVETATATADAQGQIVLTFNSLKDNAKISGLELLTTVDAPVNQAPTIATAASANPSPLTGTTSNLSVLGADDGGESNLTYTWSTTGTPPAAVVFSSNGTNASKSTTATFTTAGTYSFLVTVSDGSFSTTSAVNLTVNQIASAVMLSQASSTVSTNATETFTAAVKDQFGVAMTSPKVKWWMQSGVGSVSSTGVYTAPATAGSAVVRAAVGSLSNSASVKVMPVNQAPKIATAAKANLLSTGKTANLSVLGADDAGESKLTYIWAAIGTPPAAVVFGGNGLNASKNTTATFSKAGVYNFVVTVSDGSLSTSSTVSVTVNQTATAVAVTPSTSTINVNATQQFAVAVKDQFGNAIVSPTVTWSIKKGVGSVSSSGFYTAPSKVGSAVVKATAGSASSMASVTITMPTTGLPAGWTNADIGSPNAAGSTAYNASTGTFTLKGGGADIWGGADQFQYAYTNASGDLTIIALIASQQNTNVDAKAGVMIRDGTSPTASFVDVINTPGQGMSMEWRSSSGGGPMIQFGGGSQPWVKLVRAGNVFTSYKSLDGMSWTTIGTVTLVMSTNVTTGLVDCSHSAGFLNTSTFDNIQLIASL